MPHHEPQKRMSNEHPQSSGPSANPTPAHLLHISRIIAHRPSLRQILICTHPTAHSPHPRTPHNPSSHQPHTYAPPRTPYPCQALTCAPPYPIPPPTPDLRNPHSPSHSHFLTCAPPNACPCTTPAPAHPHSPPLCKTHTCAPPHLIPHALIPHTPPQPVTCAFPTAHSPSHPHLCMSVQALEASASTMARHSSSG